MKRKPKTVGESARLIDAAIEHLDRAWVKILTLEGHEYQPPGTNGFSVGSASYHAGAVFEYIKEAREGLYNAGVISDGQLCPYQDCCWDCGFDKPSWYICPNCKRAFWTEGSESDFEDWHTWQENDDRGNPPPKPTVIPFAQSLGPSWGTPEGNPARK